MENGTPAVAKRILPPPPIVFRPVLEFNQVVKFCFIFDVFVSMFCPLPFPLPGAYLIKLSPVARASRVPPLTRASPVL